jgi:pimeloyl-ACP methyl ester carboxylesterase
VSRPPTLPGRLPPDAVFPAGWPDLAARTLLLADGLRVRVVEPVSPAPPDAPVALFVHGWACSVYSFRHNLLDVARAGLRAVAVELKGHGESDKPTDAGGYSLQAMGRHLLDIMDALGVGRALLVGHSMGGAVAVQAALEAPDRVRGLVLLAPVGFGTIDLMWLVRLATPDVVAPVLPYVVPRLAVDVALRLAYGRHGRASARDVDEYWAPTRAPAFVRAMRRLLHAFEWAPGRKEQLQRLQTPALVLFGSKDRLVRPSSARVYVACAPNARLELIEGAGHVLPEEVSAEVNAAIVRFSSSIEARSTGDGAAGAAAGECGQHEAAQ